MKTANRSEPRTWLQWDIVLFGVGVLVLVSLLWTGVIDWLLPFLISCVGVGAIYVSQPARPRLAFGISTILLLIGIVQTHKEYSSGKSKTESRRIVANKLSKQMYELLTMHSELVVRGSDRWLPSSTEELFSSRAAHTICSELDIFQNANVYPKMSLLAWMAHVSAAYRKGIDEVLHEHRDDLDADLMKTLSDRRIETYLNMANFRLGMDAKDRRDGVIRVPLLCPGLEPVIHESLTNLIEAQRHVERLETEFQIQVSRDWAEFPEKYRKRFQGRNYFGPSEIQSWKAANPNELTINFKSSASDPNKRY